MLPDYIQQNLNECSKEQLIFLIEKYWHSASDIREICVDESKRHTPSAETVNSIIAALPDIPYCSDSEHFEAYVEYAMGKITRFEYLRRLCLLP